MKKSLIKLLVHLKEHNMHDLLEFMIEEAEDILNTETFIQLNNYVENISLQTGFTFEEHRDELITAILDSINN
jgi:hypothetical protein